MKTIITSAAFAALFGGASMAQDASALAGTWDHPDGESAVTIFEEGYLVPSGDRPWLVARFSFEDGVITIEDATGDTCQGPGAYEVAVDGDMATFTLVEDACEARSGHIDGVTLTRRADPEMDEAAE